MEGRLCPPAEPCWWGCGWGEDGSTFMASWSPPSSDEDVMVPPAAPSNALMSGMGRDLRCLPPPPVAPLASVRESPAEDAVTPDTAEV